MWPDLPLDVADGEIFSLRINAADLLQEQIHSPCPAPFELGLVIGWCGVGVILFTWSSEIDGEDDCSVAYLPVLQLFLADLVVKVFFQSIREVYVVKEGQLTHVVIEVLK